MIDRRRPAHLLVTLRPGERREHVPAHLDVLVGAARPATSLDGNGPIDRAAGGLGGFRATAVYHARRAIGRVGARATAFDDDEEALGLARTYRIRVGEPEMVDRLVGRLRDLDVVETAVSEHFATAPAALWATAMTHHRPSRADVEAPHRQVRADLAAALEEGDERVTVAVVDTGVSLGHPEFQRKLLSGYDAVELGLGRINSTTKLIGDSHGSDFAATDDVGHGSHVAGVIGAQGWQVPRGVAGRSLVLPIRVLAGATSEGDATITGVGAIGDIDAGLKIAVDLGADVINMSFGTPESALDPDGPPPHRAITEYAHRNGCVLVAAIGNSGRRERYYPAADPHVLAVGSVDAEGHRSAFSTYGDHVTISAPGEGIVSVGRRGYRVSTGTSHAAPFVSGAAALLLARARRHGRPIDARRVGEILTRTAQPSPSPADEAGAGVLDVEGAIRALDRDDITSTDVEPTHPHEQGARHG